MKTILILFLAINMYVNAQAQASENTVKNLPYEFEIVQNKPQYPGGKNEFMNFIMKNFQTEELEGLSGVIKASFVIDVDGSIKQIKIIQDIGGSSASEAKRVIGQMAKWSPATHNGEKVSVRYEFPITIN